MIKRLRCDLSDDELIGKDAIVPDLIVHRVRKRENLLVVEVKKSTNKDFDGDIWKLKGMTEQVGPYGYWVGLHLVIWTVPGLPEAIWLKLCGDGWLVRHGITSLLGACGRNGAYGLRNPSMVESIDSFQGRELESLPTSPRPSPMNDYIERFYNPRCRHSTLGYLSPMDYEERAKLA